MSQIVLSGVMDAFDLHFFDAHLFIKWGKCHGFALKGDYKIKLLMNMCCNECSEAAQYDSSPSTTYAQRRLRTLFSN